MDYREMSRRVDEVFQIDVMTADLGDFLVTHMPFEHLNVIHSGMDNVKPVSMSEEKIYQTLVRNPENQHRFMIVKGNNGTGKSHLIRWLQARMSNDLQINGQQNEKIVFIRRIDNTLRGAVGQLLDQQIVTDISQLQKMKAFVEMSVTMKKPQLMDMILDSFLSQLRTIAEEGETDLFKRTEILSFVEFLSCAPCREALMSDTGPIFRYYEHLTKPHQGTLVTSPHFEADDFSFASQKEFMRRMMEYVSVQKISTAFKKLSVPRNKDAGKLAELLNQFSQIVIQQTAQIGVGDISQIMYNLRKTLKKEGKNLTVFIEDMTTFTGLDSEIIKILSAENTGEYSDLCRVTSVIGITNAYYADHFRANFQDRVTHQIIVGSESFGSDDTLCSITARYLNASFLTRQDVDQWLLDGADPMSIPYNTEEPPFTWDRCQVGDESFTLFPFTKRSLSQLFQRLEDTQKTPRNFLRLIVREQIKAYILNQLEGELFPSMSSGGIGSFHIPFAKAAYEVDFDNLTQTAQKDEKNAFRALLCLWGDATLTRDADGKELASLPVEFIISLRYPFFKPGSLEGVIIATEKEKANVSSSESKKDVQPSKANYPAALQKELDDVDHWLADSSSTLIYSEYRRKDVADFLRDAGNWQIEGIPAYWAQSFLKDNKLVYIEGQKEKSPTADTALIVLPREEETAYILKGLAIRRHLKNWQFEESALYQLKIAIWFEKHKKQFIDALSDKNVIGSMQDLLMASLAVEYLYLGVMGGLDRNESQLRTKIFRQNNPLLVNDRLDPRPDEWGKLIKAMSLKLEENRFKDNKEILTRMVKAVLGEAQTTSDKVLIWRSMVENAFNQLSSKHWDLSSVLEGKAFSKDRRIESPFLLLREYIPKVKLVLAEDKETFSSVCEKLLYYINNPEDGNIWKYVAEESMGFLKSCNSEFGISYAQDLETELRWIRSNADTLASIVRNGKAICALSSFSAQLGFFSSDPIELYLQRAIRAFDNLQAFAVNQRLKAEQNLYGGSVPEISIKDDIDEVIGKIDDVIMILNQQEEA